MDKRKFNHGGARKGAGRKPNKTSAFTKRISALCNNLIEEALKDDVLYKKMLQEEVKKNSVKSEEAFKDTYVYIVKNQGIYKIGYSANFKKRFKNYKTNAGSVEVVYIYKGLDAFNVESELHNMFKHKKVTGEWFDLTTHELIKAISYCSNKFI